MTSRPSGAAGKGVFTAIATVFGCGYSPVAPGTAGSLAALALAYVTNVAWGAGSIHFLVAGAALFAPAVWAAGRLAAAVGRKDPGIVVVDEVVGQWIALAGATHLNWKSWWLAFVLFRVMDIVKPPPVRQLESLPGGLGIVADDAMAGIYAAAVLYMLGWWCNFY
jgi:phosphatidylglycerophosphatase A